MSTAKLSVLCSTALVALLFIVYQLALNPLRHQLTAAQTQLHLLQRDYQQRVKAQREALHYQQKINQLTQQYPALLLQLSTPLTTVRLSHNLMKLAQRYQLKVTQLAPTPELDSNTPKTPLKMQHITLLLHGDYGALQNFIAQLQSASGIFAIRALHISAPNPTAFTAKLQLECYHRASP